MDACYCRNGVDSGPGSKLEQKFSLVGFKDWKHATGKGDVLSRHDSCCAHTQKKSSFHGINTK